MEETRDKIQNWLMNEGWQIAEQPHPDPAAVSDRAQCGHHRDLVDHSIPRGRGAAGRVG